MSHARTQIIAAIAARVSAAVSVASRVSKTRIFSKNDEELPAVSILFEEEASAARTLRAGQRMLSRVARFNLQINAVATDGIEELMDSIAAEVEAAMAPALTVGGADVPITLVSTTQQTASAEMEMGGLSLIYQITYATLESDPSTLL